MRSNLMRIGAYGLGVLVVMLSAGARLLAYNASAPEIDGSSVSAGLGLLSAGILMLKARRRS